MVGGTRFELVTSSMSTRRSTTELTAHTIGNQVAHDLYLTYTKKQVLRYTYFIHGRLNLNLISYADKIITIIGILEPAFILSN